MTHLMSVEICTAISHSTIPIVELTKVQVNQTSGFEPSLNQKCYMKEFTII